MPVSARCTPTLPRKLIHSLFDFFLFVRHHAERLSLDSIGFARTANDLLLDGTMGVARKFLIFHGLTIVFHQWSSLVRFMTLETPLDERDISNWRRSRQGRLSMPRTRLPFNSSAYICRLGGAVCTSGRTNTSATDDGRLSAPTTRYV